MYQIDLDAYEADLQNLEDDEILDELRTKRDMAKDGDKFAGDVLASVEAEAEKRRI